MGLFPELDEKETIDNVKYYFNEEFSRRDARAQMNIDSIQSPLFDTVGSAGNAINTQENKVINQLRAQELVKTIYRTIENCPKEPNRLKTILKNHYLLSVSNNDTMDQAKYEKTRYNELENTALLYFAEAFADCRYL
ncbi:hypothetical protein D1B17_06940 [Companilactobacillus zhachilii]|uniref:ArpU family transcriptional regulator n=1 Tax=Companilactobacillus zhachilii TaxID=2304606 RepID=A0A386PU46_9LACO|nr:ArpU family phage packaging/lysis transcriptional regulator [Companilactobacillus zhachilii]AYE38385.1 hypothetical protein D1B17_06940 [Companilactobacillus zhachilii]